MSLPIYEFEKDITDMVANNRVTIICADTGAGKSTVVPQFLHQEGYRVIVTQPRRIAARSVAERVAQLMGVKLGGLVGYRTAEVAKDSGETEILFCTDGLQLGRELQGYYRGKRRVLVIDEVHEWNTNQETLVAYCKRELELDPELRLVLMSATIDDKAFSVYFNGAPVITVPGRLYPVEKSHTPSSKMDAVVAGLARQGHNVLAFVEGKGEIDHLIEMLELRLAELDVRILSLHGQMTSEQQHVVFDGYDGVTVVVATNVAQTSLTIPYINAVVDSGAEKRTMVVDGVEGLYLGPISQADCLQRAGRAGRTSPGVYVLCSPISMDERPRFATPEIERVRLDQLVLRLANSGLNAEELDFFHAPDPAAIRSARKSLRLLGAIDHNGAVTAVGREMGRYPLSVQYARMLVEARRRGVEGPVATIVSCLEVGGILRRAEKGEISAWREHTSQTQQRQSDLLAQLDVFQVVSQQSKGKLMEHGVDVKRFYAAKELIHRMARDMGLKMDRDMAYDPEAVMMACLSGLVEKIYTGYGQSFTNATDLMGRRLNNESIVSSTTGLVAANPWDLQYKAKNPYGEEYLVTLYLLNDVSVVTLSQLQELWPDLTRVVSTKYRLSGRRIVRRQTITFNGQSFVVESPATPGVETARALAEAIIDGMVRYPVEGENQWIQHLRSIQLCEVPTDRLMTALMPKLADAVSEEDLQELDLRLRKEDFLSSDIAAKLDFGPSTITVDGVEIRLSYEVNFVGVTVTLGVPVAAVKSLQDTPSIHADRVQLEALDDDGKVVARASSLSGLRHELTWRQEFEARNREAAARAAAERETEEECQRRLDAVIARAEALERQGISVGIDRKISDVRYGWTPAPQKLTTLVEMEGMLSKLESISPAEALLDDMFRRGSFDTLKREVAAAAIRTNGFFESETDESIRRRCERRAKELGVTTASEFYRRYGDIVPRLSDFVDAAMLEELAQAGDAAPASIEVEGRKQNVTRYPVTYGYEKRDGEMVAVGRVQLPLSIYKLNAHEHGKPKKLPELPFGIVLIIEVTQDGKVIAVGTDGSDLQTKLKKVRKGQQRSNNSGPRITDF